MNDINDGDDGTGSDVVDDVEASLDTIIHRHTPGSQRNTPA